MRSGQPTRAIASRWCRRKPASQGAVDEYIAAGLQVVQEIGLATGFPNPDMIARQVAPGLLILLLL